MENRKFFSTIFIRFDTYVVLQNQTITIEFSLQEQIDMDSGVGVDLTTPDVNSQKRSSK